MTSLQRTTSTLQRSSSQLQRNASRLDRSRSSFRREGSSGPVWDGSGGPEPKTNAIQAAREAENSGKNGDNPEPETPKASAPPEEKPQKRGFLSMICPCMGSPAA